MTGHKQVTQTEKNLLSLKYVGLFYFNVSPKFMETHKVYKRRKQRMTVINKVKEMQGKKKNTGNWDSGISGKSLSNFSFENNLQEPFFCICVNVLK